MQQALSKQPTLQLSPFTEVQQRYQAAIGAVVEKLQQDRYILAAVLFGSLARGEGWQKSNVDLVIIRDDGPAAKQRRLWLTEGGLIIEAQLVPRNDYKRIMERTLQGSVAHSIRTLSKVLFCKDETIAAWFSEETDDIGANDQARQVLGLASGIPPLVRKAEKWLVARNDIHYSFVWILYAVNQLARVEMVLNGKAPAREVIQQALACNPTFFNAIYTELIEGPKTAQAMRNALDLIDQYLQQHAAILFKPVLDYLAESPSPCTSSDLYAHFRNQVPDSVHLYAYEWLAEKGIIQKLAAPYRLSKKSQVELQQPAYYFDANFDWETWQAPPFEPGDVQTRYLGAVEALKQKLAQDRYVVAAILYGSVSRRDFWAKSDVDLFVVPRDDVKTGGNCWLVEDGVLFDTFLIPRQRFKRSFDGALQGTFSHSVRSQCTVLFSQDDTLSEWLADSAQVNERDQALQLLRAASDVPYWLRKANKWLVARNDVHYSFLWTIYVVNRLATVEVVLNGEAPGREVIHQALKVNPDFFNAVYIDLIEQPKTAQAMRQVLDLCDQYLTERTEQIFQPILDYLLEARAPVAASELDAHFRKKVQGNLYGFAYEWLVEKGLVDKVSVPLLLTRRSQVAVEEAAYFYDEDVPDWDWE